MPRTAVPTRRRVVPSTPSFIAATTTSAFNRPTPGTPAAAYAAGWTLVPFNSKAGLDTALAAIAGSQYIYYSGPGAVPTGTDFALGNFYSGSGILTINTTTAGIAYSISGRNPAALAAIDFGCAKSLWGTPTVSNYVKFTQNKTSANGNSALSILACSNIAVYGGEYTSTAHGIAMRGALNRVTLLDAWIHDVAQCGILCLPSTSSGGVATIQNTTIRAEVGPNWAMNPAIDVHPDKGSGVHGALLFDSGNGSSFTNNTVCIYAHDSLQQGATSYGQTWPEGGGGGVIEIGQPSGGTPDGSGNTLYALGVNNKMKPNGTNPGSTASQTGGNGIEFWGNIALTGLVVGWVECQNVTGGCTHGDGATGWRSGGISVQHGRSHGGAGVGTNLSTVGSNGSPQNVPYPVFSGVTYSDCT